MPVPEPRPGFVERALRNATRRDASVSGRLRAAMRRPATWWAAGAGALAATLACVAIVWLGSTPPESAVTLALNEHRDVSLVIDSERDLEGATIRLYLSGSVSLAGYEGEREIEWLTSLTRGANLLSLPVVALAPGDGRIVAEIEHEGRARRVSVAMHVAAPAKDDIG
ncbi:MAG TPA: hypothetical protein VFS13_00865 [Steroidobacteraceae bacterium]|nr:hypothetical protein [Steroidobacteraceae bacterium]